MENIKEIGISQEYKFRGKIVNLRVDTVKTPEGNTALREIVEHPGGVGIVALDEENNVYMEWQYRRPFDDVIYEIPAGKLEKGEDPKESAIRELEEEVGLKAKNWVYLGPSLATPGFCTEVLHVYLARDLYQGKIHRDADEVLVIEKVPLDTLVEKVMSGEIKDGKSIIGILKTKEYLRKQETD
ncbi:MAG: NUDIX hydrolase [Clostridia bacterium]